MKTSWEKQIKKATNFILGKYENDILDGNRTEMPPRDLLIDLIYDEVMDSSTGATKKEIRFAGKDAIFNAIEKALDFN